MSGELDQISRAIGGLEEAQRALVREIDAGFRSVRDELNQIRQSYHDLNNKAQRQMGEMEAEFQGKVESLDTRVAGLEILVAKYKGAVRANHSWIAAIGAAVGGGITLIAEYFRDWHK